MFNIEKLTEFAIAEIEKFAAAHQDETFYGFAIDADLLCLNSVEHFERSLSEYRTNWDYRNRKTRGQHENPYFDPTEIEELRQNTGDWEYQGFAQMRDKDGFYDRHYGMSDARQKTSAYGKAMDQLLERIAESGVLEKLKRTEDFQIRRVEHTY
jgi:hypothetical protein